ncbi:MAG: RNA methyltransferase [Ignavibacteria bacterium]|nr:RNA methyltransferase [Ignavibacteria bacterium]
MRTERRMARLVYVLRHRQPDLTVVIENVHDPHNVSAILRSCDAAGVTEVQLVYTVEGFPKIGRKSSASAGKWVERREYRSIRDCYSALREKGFRIYATRLTESAVSVYDVDLTRRVAIVVGNEHRGVSGEAAAEADGTIQIPMFGMIRSLNVSVASAIMLYEAVRQRLKKGHYKRSRSSKKKLEQLIEQWMRR